MSTKVFNRRFVCTSVLVSIVGNQSMIGVFVLICMQSFTVVCDNIKLQFSWDNGLNAANIII